MGGNIFDMIAPIVGATLLGQPELGLTDILGATGASALGAGLGTGIETGIKTGNPLAGLEAGAAGGAGSFLGSNIGGMLGGASGGASGGIGGAASGAAGAGSAAASSPAVGLSSSFLSQPTSDLISNSLGGGQIAQGLGSLAGSSSVGQSLGSMVGQSVASNLNAPIQSNITAPQGWRPSVEPNNAVPMNLTGALQGMSPQQQLSYMATQGVYGNGQSPQDQGYFLNQLNNYLTTGPNQTQSFSSITPIEQSYLSRLGLGGFGDTNSLLQAMSGWQQPNT